jgi:hypothetical protein
MSLRLRVIGHRKDDEIPIADDHRSGRYMLGSLLGQRLLTSRLQAVHRPQVGPFRQSRIHVVEHHNPHYRPVRFAMMILCLRVGFHQFGAILQLQG